MWTWVYAGLAVCVAMAVYGASQAHAANDYRECWLLKQTLEFSLDNYSKSHNDYVKGKLQREDYEQIEAEQLDIATKWATIYSAWCKK